MRARYGCGNSAPGDVTLKNDRLVGLDLLRFFCAVSVMVFHLAYWSRWPDASAAKSVVQAATAYQELAPYTWWGWVGVEIFFVISGFVISQSAAKATPYSFFRGRLLRLAPGVWICATMTFAVMVIMPGQSFPAIAVRYAHTMVLDPLGGWISGVYWTLPIEVAFYAMTWLLLLVGRFRWLTPLMTALAVCSCAIWLSRLGQTMGLISTGIPYSRVTTLFVDYSPYFAIGVLIQGSASWRIPVIAALSALSVVPVAMGSTGYAEAAAGHVAKLAAPAVYLAGVFVIILIKEWGNDIDRHLPSWALRLVSFVGRATYPLYLLHSTVGTACLCLLVPAGMNRFAALAVVMAAMVALAMVVTATAEPLVRGWLARIFPKVPPHRLADATAAP